MKDSKTFQNLMNAFVGESQAVQRYTQYAKIAKKEGWSNISAVFEETAVNEHYHAKEFYDLLLDMVGEDNLPEFMSASAEYPIARKSTIDNLLYAANGETEEVTDYLKFSEEAKEEGYKAAAMKFKLVSAVEASHAKRYNEIANLLKVEEFTKKEDKVQWKCMKCGHIHTGKSVPGKCPICDHDGGHFELFELYY